MSALSGAQPQRHCEAYAQQRGRVLRLAGRRELDADQVEELIGRIDAERAGRRLVTEFTALPEPDRAVIELVDLAGLRPAEAAAAAPATHDAEHEGHRP